MHVVLLFQTAMLHQHEVTDGDNSVECDNGSWIGAPLNCNIRNWIPIVSSFPVMYLTLRVHPASYRNMVGSHMTKRQWFDVSHLVLSFIPRLDGPACTTGYHCRLCHGTPWRYIVTYVCSDGYESVGGNHTLKFNSGIWNGDILICEITGKGSNIYTYNITFHLILIHFWNV